MKTLIYELTKNIENGYKIILYNYNDKTILKKLCLSIKTKEIKMEIWTTKSAEDNNFQFITKEVSKSDFDELLEFYFLYEFTDMITVVSDDSIYPGVINYLQQGIITDEEFIESIIHK